MKLKKLFAGLISLAAALLAVCAITVCAGAETSGDYEYSVLDGGTVKINYYSGSATDLSIPATIGGKKVTNIGWRAFEDCSSLTSIDIPNGVTGILNYAFYNCSNLISINIPESVDSIGYSASSAPWTCTFYGCTSLTSINVDKNNKVYSSQDGVLFNKDMTEIMLCPVGKKGEYIIPNGVTCIGEWAFSDCTSLTSVTIPDGVAEIKSSAFSRCTSLTSINIPNSVTSMGWHVFSDTPFLNNQPTTVKYAGKWAVDCDEDATTITNKSGTVGIADWAFQYYRNLTSVTIPDGVTSIGDCAFSECTNLSSINIPNSVTSIGFRAFSNTPFLDKQTDTVKYAGKWVIGCDEDATTAAIKSGTVGIAGGAFQYCRNLTSITIPDGVTSMEHQAFYGCSSLAKINIPGSVTSIGSSAFSGCSSLTSITIPDSVTNIGNSAFSGCSSLTSITIPNGVTSIGEYAFYDCSSLTSITIPDSITNIGNYAFNYRCENLKDVYYIGSKSQWDKIAIGTYNEYLLGANIHYLNLGISGLKLKGRSGDALRLAWTKNTSADGYIIEMKDGSKWVRVGKITKNSTVEFRKAGLKAGTAYSFRVKAYKMVGKTALYSGYTTISARTNPSAVTGLKLKGRSGDALRISWAKNTSADGYIIEMKSGNSWTRVGKITNNSTVEFKKSKLKAGTAYTFRVKAYKMSGKTALYSGYTSISARTNPSTVTGLKLKGRAGDALRISWAKNTSADGYIIEMKSGNGWTRVGKITKNSTIEFKKSKLKAGTAYTFRVKAYKMSGKTALYGATKTISVRTNPSAVSGLKLKASAKNAVRLSWTKNTSADGYIIEMKSGNSWVRVGKVTKNSTVEFRKGSLKSKTSYSFRIKAYKMSGKTALYSGYKTITVKTK